MNWNVVILGRNAIQIAVALHHLPAIKLREYQKYPLAHKVGFIHSLPEDKFDMANATITDVSFMGLFPKALLQILLQYANEIKWLNRDDNKFRTLIDDLITAFIYRPITMQTIIQIMVVHKKNELQALDSQNLTTPSIVLLMVLVDRRQMPTLITNAEAQKQLEFVRQINAEYYVLRGSYKET